MNFDEMTIGEARELACMFQKSQCNNGPYKIGDVIFIRCVTNFWTGEIVEVYDNEIVLKDAAWIADTGRFSDAIKKGELVEVEPVNGLVIVGRGAIIDVCQWDHKLPKDRK